MTIFWKRLRSTCIVLSSRHLSLLYLAISIDVNGTVAFQKRIVVDLSLVNVDIRFPFSLFF